MRIQVLAGVTVVSLFTATPGFAQTSAGGISESILWNCTGFPCPWGDTDAGIALVWPTAAAATSTRHGYTTSKPVYLPASAANGAAVEITSGSATAYAGAPQGGGHRALITLFAGESTVISGLAADEVLSVQSGESFSWQVTLPPAPPPPPPPPPPAGLPSVAVTWTCTGAPCPWGATDTGNAVEWPNVPERISARYGYTTSQGIYLGAARANGTTIHIVSGDVGVYAGTLNAPHRNLTVLSEGDTFVISGLAPDEMVSVQSASPFQYEVTLGEYTPPPPEFGTPSQLVTWQCTGVPCPWGETTVDQALVWPAAANPTNARLGYTTSHGIYLPRNYVAGTTIEVTSGSATAYAGVPGAPSHQAITTIAAGGSYTFSELAAGEVLSVVGDAEFRYELALGPFVPDAEIPEPGDVIHSVASEWRCDFEGCPGNWYSHVIDWPEWAAYSDNARSGNSFRRTYGESGEPIHPYMGAWANGCRVTAQSGVVLIIEWQRGTETWRETYLNPGESHTIHLTTPEDGAMIESYDFSPGFSITLQNCTPQPLP